MIIFCNRQFENKFNSKNVGRNTQPLPFEDHKQKHWMFVAQFTKVDLFLEVTQTNLAKKI